MIVWTGVWREHSQRSSLCCMVSEASAGTALVAGAGGAGAAGHLSLHTQTSWQRRLPRIMAASGWSTVQGSKSDRKWELPCSRAWALEQHHSLYVLSAKVVTETAPWGMFKGGDIPSTSQWQRFNCHFKFTSLLSPLFYRRRN